MAMNGDIVSPRFNPSNPAYSGGSAPSGNVPNPEPVGPMPQATPPRPEPFGWGRFLLKTLILLILLAAAAYGGYYYEHKKLNTADAQLSTAQAQAQQLADQVSTLQQQQQQAAQTDPYAGWTTATFAPENLKLKFPSDVKLQQPTKLAANDTSGSSAGEYGSALANGFSIQIEMITSPSTNNSFGNLDKATQVATFNYQGATYYIVNDGGIALSVSTCADKVCAYTSHSNAKDGILIFVHYADPTKTPHQAPDPIPANSSYVPTVEKILQSLSY